VALAPPRTGQRPFLKRIILRHCRKKHSKKQRYKVLWDVLDDPWMFSNPDNNMGAGLVNRVAGLRRRTRRPRSVVFLENIHDINVPVIMPKGNRPLGSLAKKYGSPRTSAPAGEDKANITVAQDRVAPEAGGPGKCRNHLGAGISSVRPVLGLTVPIRLPGTKPARACQVQLAAFRFGAWIE
jgi:hypothetical protein